MSNNIHNFKTSNKLTTLQPKPKAKKKLLCWSDSVLATTGFGVVSKHILAALHATGEYSIDQLAINHSGEFYDPKDTPYTIVPARLGDPKDPYGSQMFVDALLRKDYDYVLIINDTFVVEQVAQTLHEVVAKKKEIKHKPFALVYYYPVDCRLLPDTSTMVKIADRAVAYTNFAKDKTEAVGLTATDVIYHGADINSFHPVAATERALCRKQYLNVESDDTFVFVSVNRNSPRKDIARTILAFSEFKKQVTSNTKLYLHTRVIDGVGQGFEIDLRVPLAELALDIRKDVIFPNKFNPAKGFPVHILNQLYSCGDVFITTNLGEGAGLTLLEAMACGVPVITPHHTSATEIFGGNTVLPRGYLIPCRESTYVDNSGFRPFARMDDILEQMKLAYRDWQEAKTSTTLQHRHVMINEARKFTQRYSWANVCKDWVKLFSELKPHSQEVQGVMV